MLAMLHRNETKEEDFVMGVLAQKQPTQLHNAFFSSLSQESQEQRFKPKFIL